METAENLPENVYAASYQISENGVISENLALSSLGEGAYAIFQASTSISDSEGNDFTGVLLQPTIVESDTTLPTNKQQIGNIYEFGSSTAELNFNQPVTLRFVIPNDTDHSADLAVYYLFNTTNEWIKAGDGGSMKQLTDGNLVMEVEVDHFTKYVVLENTGDTVSENTAAQEMVLGDTDIAPNRFVDIVDHWAKDYISDIYSKGIINGYDATHYGPYNNISRAEFTKVVINMFNIELTTTQESSFADVNPEDWYMPYVQTAADAGIVDGYEDKTFRPDNEINRAEAMKILLMANNTDTTDAPDAQFPDVDPLAWYAPYINYAAAHNIVGGYENGNFGPNDNLTRGQVAKVASLMLAE